MVKKIASFNIKDTALGMIEQISTSLAESKSEIVERAIFEYCKSSWELTAEQRYHSHRETILKKCVETLKLSSITAHEGGVSDQIMLIMALVRNSKYQRINEIRNGIQKISLFELLNDVKGWDKNVFDKITSNMSEFKKLKEEYFNLYPL